MITCPQFDNPFRLAANGTPIVVQQDSPADIAACVTNIVLCPVGAKHGDPTFGVPSLLFQTVPLQTDGVLAAIQRLEPRATTTISEVADFVNVAIRDVTIAVQTREV